MADENIQNELNLDAKVTVKNIAGWDVGFARKSDGIGDIKIAPCGSIRLSRGEIIAQIQSGNKLFNGTDDLGSHATLFIDDEATRREVGFDTEEKKQVVFSEEKVKEVFAIKKQTDFESRLKTEFYTRAEKYAVMEAIRKQKINDYSKIRFTEIYTGYKYQ